MKFARRARWLSELFTASVTPPTRYPDEYSKDVSLVQPYDGGGIVLADPTSLVHTGTSAASATSSTTIVSVGAEEILRVYAVSAFLSAGVAGTGILQLHHVDIAMTASISARFAIDALWNAILTPGLIIGPKHEVIGNFTGGDAASVVVWRIYGALVPAGTVFYT